MPIQTIVVKLYDFPIRKIVVNIEGPVPEGGNSFPSANSARVDNDGDDSTGVVGDLSKPFKTVQPAIDGGAFVIYLTGGFQGTDNITVGSAQALTFIGERPGISIAFPLLTFADGIEGNLNVINCTIGDVVGNSPSDVVVTMTNSVCGDITNTTDIVVRCNADTGDSDGTFTGLDVQVLGFDNPNNGSSNINIACPDGNAAIYNSILRDVTCNALFTQDSRIQGSLSVATTTTNTDVFLNPALMDFSTLPTTEPITIGSAWIDTTGGNNIVKVKL